MTKIYLATKQEVTVVKDDLTTLNTQINTPSFGIDARVQNLEGKGLEIERLRVDVDFIEDQIENPTTGILKMISDIDTEINEADTGIKARLTGLEQGGTVTTKFRTHTPSGKYEDGEIVQKDGGQFSANGAIDGSTTAIPFVAAPTGANTWKPVIGGVWNTTNAKQVLSSNASDTLVTNPSATGIGVKLSNSDLTITNPNNRVVATIDASNTLLESPTVNRCKVSLSDSNVSIETPNASGTPVAKFVATLNETTIRGPLATNNNTFTLGSSGRSTLTVAGVDKLDTGTTNSMFGFNATNKIDVADNSLIAKINNHDKLQLTNTFSTIRSGTGANSEFSITGDTSTALKVNNVTKLTASATGHTDLNSTATTYYRATSGNALEGYSNNNRRFLFDSAGVYLYSLANTNDRLEMISGSQKLVMGGVNRLIVDGTETSVVFNNTNFYAVRSNGHAGKVGDLEKINLNATTSSISFNADNLLETSSGIAKMRAAGQDRIWANSTECRMRSPDTNTYLNLVNGAASIFAGGGEKLNLNATSSWIGFNGTNNFESTTDKALIRSNGVERMWNVASSSGMRSPNSDSDISVSNGSVSIKAGSTSGNISFTINSNERLSIGSLITARATFVPSSTNVYDLGGASQRFATIYAQNALNTPSDMTLKENIKDIPDALLDAWGKHVSPKQFNWIADGADGVIHFSFMAQHIIAAFDDAGLDWKKYGVVSGDGVNEKHGVVYTEAQVIETAYQRRRIAKLEALIEAMK